ncbi:hypothetical protein [Aureibaculum marinum]|uniref:hypothetical protein n=1 Tax=Aureibaculum marinum TaxID=2487930 RepID=UPI00139667CE|nr:hypothetical protein [Aureibaculum marinum]
MSKKIRDSIFLSSDLYKEHPNHRVNKSQLKIRRALDTIYLKKIADKLFYQNFLKNDAHWKREKRHKKIKHQLDSIFSEAEVVNYKKLLDDNNYVWNPDKIDFKDRVFMVDELIYTKKEMDKFAIDKKDSSNLKIRKFNKKNNLFVFSKPLYSLNKNTALIVYTYSGNYVLLIFDKKGKNWQFKHKLSESYFISKIE